MPLYTFECTTCGKFDVVAPMSEAQDTKQCTCGRISARVFDVPHFLEDRLRFSRNPRTGEDFSDMLGTSYPKDRKERDAIYAQKGIEPVTASTMPEIWKERMAYKKHVDSGGERLSGKDLEPLHDKPDLSDVKSISQQLKESGLRLGA